MAFAVIDEHGREHGYGMRRQWCSVSTLKTIPDDALPASVRDRPLSLAERKLLSPMIRRSDNAPASQLVVQLGAPRIEAFARRYTGLRSFRLAVPWGSSIITLLGYARFMRRIDSLLPPRHGDLTRLSRSRGSAG